MNLGDRDVTTEESDRYLLAVDAASTRVISGVAGTSQQGRALRYAIVGEPGQRHAAGARARPRGRGEADGPADLGPRGARRSRARTRRSCGSRATSTAARRADRRRAAHALRARRPRGLRGRSDPRERARGDPADAEPGRPRGRHAPQRLRVRHEPRLVRPHAAGDRRQGRAAAPLPGRDVHRRPRDGPRQLLLPAERGPDLPRDHRPGGRLDQQRLRRARCRTSSASGASRSSTTTSTTSSTWATATPCPRPASARPA